MDTSTINGVKLEYEVRGQGEPVLLIHGALVAETFGPMMREPSLANHRLIRVHRRGYAGSEHPDGPSSLTLQAEDAIALLRHLGISRAHVAGHSYGGLLALRVALIEPSLVQSLGLLEPPMLATPTGQEFVDSLRPVVGKFRAGDAVGAAESFCVAVGGPNAVAGLKSLPRAYDQAVRDVGTLFAREFPVMAEGMFIKDEAPKLRMPALSVVGEKSEPVFRHSHDLLMQWLPNVEALEIPAATHFLQVEQPRAVAEGLAAFFRRHAMS
jgi:pimeloyl-ACP methyl ester carboxylesterase